MEIISILAENNSGVMPRIAGLFGRRGYSINSITCSGTNIPGIARLTISIEGDKKLIDQVIHQVAKLVEVRNIERLDHENTVQREQLLVKVKADESTRSHIREVAEIFKAKIVDLAPESMTAALSGKPSNIDAFLEVLKHYEILEMCRSGVIALSRGSENVMKLPADRKIR
ncbi:MAG: acetolactate synthase small subunit [Firmicutes bacterium]|nr:acetolactate synthase small subunit [Clostridiales bacterium]MBQ9930739.1 acetolactate synthase small subunit [Bacillota bacterium]